ncbi:DUF3102 domain-containing protein [Desulfosporosinus lacus]|uniref:Uncharacterized protein n=1 Tax=Desulfosporosinus lacus DSM 15449 TaxID=1121420 RepID=A0A1M5VEQ7_9FIRM|nr:Protein of unknown function [Desulfosporosinus lacus DSM 15449]
MRMEVSNRTPEQIASELNFIKEQSGKMLLSNAVEQISHEEWLKWPTESVSYSPVGEERPNVAPVQHLILTPCARFLTPKAVFPCTLFIKTLPVNPAKSRLFDKLASPT